MQPHLTQHLRESFREEMQDMKYYSTPGTPRFKIVRPNEEIEGVDEMMQSRYRSCGDASISN
jgi:hypothetical protein